MEDTQTPPAGEHAETVQTSLSDILSPASAAADTGAMSGPEVGQEPEPQPQAPAQQPGTSAQPAPKAETQAQPEEPKPPKWYRDHMAQVNRERQSERAEIERLRAAAQPQPRQQQQQNDLPDPLENPGAYAMALEDRFNQRLQHLQLISTLQLSERFARQQHGNEAFEECQAWLSANQRLEPTFLNDPDPWGAAIAHFKRERLAEEIGDDPAAYRAKIEEQIRAEYEARLQQQPNPAPSTPSMRPPPPAPASSAPGGSPPRDAAGRFTGPTPMSDILGSKGR